MPAQTYAYTAPCDGCGAFAITAVVPRKNNRFNVYIAVVRVAEDVRICNTLLEHPNDNSEMQATTVSGDSMTYSTIAAAYHLYLCILKACDRTNNQIAHRPQIGHQGIQGAFKGHGSSTAATATMDSTYTTATGACSS